MFQLINHAGDETGRPRAQQLDNSNRAVHARPKGSSRHMRGCVHGVARLADSDNGKNIDEDLRCRIRRAKGGVEHEVH